jgi:predicted  nucleic acid-binding Zn-ribbon protein
MPNSWDDETKKKISAGARKSWESGERKHPITTLKEQLEDVKARLARLDHRDGRLQEVIDRHRDLIDRARAASAEAAAEG